MTWRTLASLVHPHSDIGISKLSGPVGIIRVFHLAAQADIRIVLWFTILVNINLAVFNLLPIPVLDGGHMLFADGHVGLVENAKATTNAQDSRDPNTPSGDWNTAELIWDPMGPATDE